ncbi:3-carboxymuconate cyclase [Pigmentiphaga sp. H8]|uniref:lactonase family protein n=1 Tax=Pigmentiphaga sp. H8 TaxID=2488560 RepID=UPI000F5AE8F2|nr:beta-propeller fold lactonase family protein [Pigmentiphaga sp. H8]AZG08275.1 3-carboxymuconate cyclase [Pigmentiphaga sp. H8]
MSGATVLYSAVGNVLARYEIDRVEARLTRRAEFLMPSRVQYAWRHPALRVLYVTTASSGPRTHSRDNQVTAFRIDREGGLCQLGETRNLAARAVHLCVDPEGKFVINAHNFPRSWVTVHRIRPDGSLGEAVEQDEQTDFGSYPHQVMAFPDASAALVVDRGNHATQDKPEDPGALRVYPMKDGRLVAGQVVAPGGGFGFGPRHVAFHPGKPWLYVADERHNCLAMFRVSNGSIEERPAYVATTLENPGAAGPRQLVGAIHVHPDGRHVYVANRADETMAAGGRKVFAKGENSIAVFQIDPSSGEPVRIQNADIGSFHARTFALDPAGGMLVAASIKAMNVLRDGEIEHVPAALSVFRIGPDGRLAYQRKYDVPLPDGELQYWMGMVEPA